MRLIVLILLLALAFGTAQASPLQGSDGTATVTLFGAIRTPVEDNETMEILKVDVGLMGTENATYELKNAKDVVFQDSFPCRVAGKRFLPVHILIFCIVLIQHVKSLNQKRARAACRIQNPYL